MTTDSEQPSRLHRILCRLHGLFATLIGLILLTFGCVLVAARVMGSTLGGLVDKPAETPILLGLFGVGLGILSIALGGLIYRQNTKAAIYLLALLVAFPLIVPLLDSGGNSPQLTIGSYIFYAVLGALTAVIFISRPRGR
jgi:hypothetical protein